MESEISTKNTKSEILSAYDELLKKVQDKKTEGSGTAKTGESGKKSCCI
jgi:hypothetical protein